MQYIILLFSFYRYLVLQLKVQFDYEISQHISEISRYAEVPRPAGWDSLLYSVERKADK
jgi:hypothetical protein